MTNHGIAAAALALCAAPSFAATPGSWYAGVDAGRTSVEGFDDRHASYGGFAAYQVTAGIAVEVAARRLGRWDFDGNVTVKQAGLAMVASLPVIGPLGVYGRAGYNHLDIDNASHRVTLRKRTLDGGNVGLGLAWHVTPAIACRVEYQLAARDVRNLGASVLFRF